MMQNIISIGSNFVNIFKNMTGTAVEMSATAETERALERLHVAEQLCKDYGIEVKGLEAIALAKRITEKYGRQSNRVSKDKETAEAVYNKVKLSQETK